MKRSDAIETGRLALTDEATDLLACDIAGEVEMSAIRAAAGEPTIAELPIRSLRFDQERRWRFDFAWPARMIAAEVESSTAAQKSAALYRNELEKYNTAALLGWRVFRFSPQDVKKGRALELLRLALNPLVISQVVLAPNRNEEKNADGTDAGTTDGPARPPL